MPTFRGSVRRLVFTPQLAEVSFARRGFPATPTAATRQLEAIPQSVICGFDWAIDTRDQWEIERRLAIVDPGLRGFAYEGATMAFTILDVMGRGHRTRDLLLGPGQPHVLLAYIGMGFAMARLPRPLWKKVVPDLTGDLTYPVMSWLAVDGYGFDRAYFQTRRWVDEQRPPAPYPWQGSAAYFGRAVDQGIGRALWFIHGGQVADVATRVRRFASHRHADLWSGVGLAATFAGGCDSEGLAELRRTSGEHAADLGVGVVFAAEARSYAGYVPPYTHTATAALTGLTIEAVDALAVSTMVQAEVGTAELPAYEMWRQNIRSKLPDATGG